jgi:enoyl-CoA hydratase/carnithine racemase
MNDPADLALTHSGHVAHLRWSRPPHNHVDPDFIGRLADQLDALDADPQCRVVLLSAQGKAFCAGADFWSVGDAREIDPGPFYAHAMRLFRTRKPLVAAVHGAAIGAGLGLALVADYRVAGPATRLSANFVRLGFHPGFGLTETLPRLIGMQRASVLLCTGQRIDGAQALAMGLVDACVAHDEEVLPHAMAWAQTLAEAAPVALQSTRASLRQGLADAVLAANQHELQLQRQQFAMADFREGIAAMAQRRTPLFTGT